MKKYPIDLFNWGLAEKTLRSYASLNGHTNLLSFAEANCHDAPTRVALHAEEDYGVSFYKDPKTQEIKFSIFDKKTPFICPIRDQSIHLFANVDNALVNNQTTKKVCINIIRQIKELHEKKYVHLDIKPENFLLDGEKVIVIDFGFSRVINSVPAQNAADGAYQPPEIILRAPRGFLPDVRSDIWSLGLMLFFMKYKKEFSFMEELHDLDKLRAADRIAGFVFKGKAQEIFDSIAANGLFKPEQLTNTNSLEHVISLMVKVEPKERIPLDKVLELLELLPETAYSPAVADNC